MVLSGRDRAGATVESSSRPGSDGALLDARAVGEHETSLRFYAGLTRVGSHRGSNRGLAEAFNGSRMPWAEDPAIQNCRRLLGGLGGDLQRVVDIVDCRFARGVAWILESISAASKSTEDRNTLAPSPMCDDRVLHRDVATTARCSQTVRGEQARGGLAQSVIGKLIGAGEVTCLRDGSCRGDALLGIGEQLAGDVETWLDIFELT